MPDIDTLPMASITSHIAGEYATQASHPLGSGDRHPVFLSPNSLYITTQPSDHTEFSWSLVLTDEAGHATRYAWSNRKQGMQCPSPGHLVVIPAGYKTNAETILPAQVVNTQPLRPPCNITNGRINLAYFHVEGFFPMFCIDAAGTPCFEALCHSVYTMSFVTSKMNREAGMTSQAWVMSVLNSLENLGCIIRADGRLVAALEQDVLNKSRALEKEFDEDLREYLTEVVPL